MISGSNQSFLVFLLNDGPKGTETFSTAIFNWVCWSMHSQAWNYCELPKALSDNLRGIARLNIAHIEKIVWFIREQERFLPVYYWKF